jgi:glycosyltransferase involved in cell wall biosynthesis
MLSLGSIYADRRLRAAVRDIVAIPMLPLMTVAALVARLDTARRRRRRARARLVWGPTPILNIKYWSAALRTLGYDTRTCVFEYYAINKRDDFDVHFDEFLPRGLVFDPVRPYAVFLWVLRSADVYLSYFDGGFLQGTALRRLELQLLRLAGKRVIVLPYGRDIAVPGYLGVAEERVLEDYPEFVECAEQTRQRVLEFADGADLVVRNYQYGFLPRWDILWPTLTAIDTESWRPVTPLGDGDGHSGEVVVVHAPNHRRIKGTDLLIEAVEELEEEGLRVRLHLLERQPNAEVRAAIDRADIVADQFIAGYALFAVEGMASARPVLSALKWMAPEVRENLSERGLPIVDTDADNLIDTLRELVRNPARRHALGESGRRFALEHQSYEAVGGMWDAIIQHVWLGTPLPPSLRRSTFSRRSDVGSNRTSERVGGR